MLLQIHTVRLQVQATWVKRKNLQVCLPYVHDKRHVYPPLCPSLCGWISCMLLPASWCCVGVCLCSILSMLLCACIVTCQMQQSHHSIFIIYYYIVGEIWILDIWPCFSWMTKGLYKGVWKGFMSLRGLPHFKELAHSYCLTSGGIWLCRQVWFYLSGFSDIHLLLP